MSGTAIPQNPYTGFFKAGGTLSPENPSYVRRPADDELFDAVKAGKFCYVLTTRQMGKSSLMARTAPRLEKVGIRTAIIDLTHIGTHATAKQWYLGLLTHLVKQLNLKVDVELWWQDNDALSPVQGFTNFLRDMVLNEILEPIAIFIDEIDSTLSLNFSDDFFAAIRALYNARATEPIYERLTFILLGVATPTDLMKDHRRTPFNIGTHIDLHEFRLKDIESEDSLRKLRRGLENIYPGEGDFIFERVFYWTGGHPYLTQKLCIAIVDEKVYKKDDWVKEDVDNLVERLFLSEKERGEPNIHFVNNQVLKNPNKDELLRLYRRVYQGEKVTDDKRSHLHNQLKLTGLVKVDDGNLLVNNRIYKHVFDLNWIDSHLESVWSRYAFLIAAAAVVTLIIAGIIVSSFIVNDEPTPTPTTMSITTTAPIVILDPSETPVAQNTPVPATTEAATTEEPTTTPTFEATEETPTNTPIPSPTPLPSAIANGDVNIYSAPSSNFEVAGRVSAGETVTVRGISANGDWLFVENANGDVGFVEKSNFSSVDESQLDEIPTPENAAITSSASILSAPEFTEENELVIVNPGDFVEVLGRSANSSWLYVRNQNGVEGFIAISLLDWPASAEEIEALSIQ